MKLVDGHCHRVLFRPLSPMEFELASTEADRPPPPGVSYLDGAVGLAIRRWCAPVLGLDARAPMREYLDRRSALSPDEVTRLLLGAAGLSHMLVDTGPTTPGLVEADRHAGPAGSVVRDVVRLEAVAEQVAERLAAERIAPGEFVSLFPEALERASGEAVALKSILAYRHGFSIDPRRPASGEAAGAATRWLAQARPYRLEDPVLLRFVLWAGVDRGLPIQMHTGFGDRDLVLAQADPALLQPFLGAVEPTGVPVVLLHCYPYQRQAGWLAQVYPNVYVDVGLTVAQVGARADAVLGEFFELAPFAKLLFSTDGHVIPELHLVGAAQFRHSLVRLLEGWVDEGAMRTEDAERCALAVGSANARRLYGL